MLSRCSDDLLYDEPPCTDYADASYPPLSGGSAAVDAASLGLKLASSPAELLQTAAGLPLMLAVFVVILHAVCCFVQGACGAEDGQPDQEAKATPRDAMRHALGRGNWSWDDKTPLVG